MYVLDTNVISELVRAQPASQVVAWVDAAPDGAMYLASPTIAEIARGVHRLPSSKRKAQLEVWLNESLLPRFADKTLSFDAAAAMIWGRLMGQGEAGGRTPPDRDCQIAAIALAHGFAVVTRNVADFQRLGVPTIDPWGAA